MKIDLEQFVEWHRKMESEGGVAELAEYGRVPSGSKEIDQLMDSLADLLDDIYSEVDDIMEQYEDEIDKLQDV